MNILKSGFLWAVFIIAMMTSCQKDNDGICVEVLTCEGDCIDVVQNQEGVTAFLSCYARYGVSYSIGEDNQFFVIPYEWDSTFESDSIDVQFCGYLFENDIPMAFPDPSFFGKVYRIRLEAIEKK